MLPSGAWIARIILRFMDISLSHMNIFEIELNCSISGETSLA